MAHPNPVSQRVAILGIAEKSCAIRLGAIREIVHMARLHCPPGMPGILAGFLNLSGTAVPVVRLDRLFNLREIQVSIFTQLVIVETLGGPLALMAERVTDIVALNASNQLPLTAPDTFNGCVESLFEFGNKTIQLLSIDRILLEKERQCLSDFQTREQERLRQLSIPAEASV